MKYVGNLLTRRAYKCIIVRSLNVSVLNIGVQKSRHTYCILIYSENGGILLENKKLTPHELMHFFMKTDKLHRCLVEMKMNNLNIHRSQHHMLLCISLFEAPPTQKMIAERLGISAATVTITVKKLEASGYVTRISDKYDNRCNTIEITEKGLDILARGKEIMDSIDKVMFSGLTDTEITQFAQSLSKIQENLRSCGASLPDRCR